MVLPPPSAAKDLRTIYDVIWVNYNYIKKVEPASWKPQMSVKNCNRTQMWNLLTIYPNDLFHILERKIVSNPPQPSVFYKWNGEKFQVFTF